jgi:DNA polymerase-3 subunit alpha
MNFCHLHVHDQYSQLDGYGSAEQYADEASRLEFTHLALTNHGNVDGLIKFQKACLGKDIVPILGSELYVVPDISIKEPKEKRYHITVLVKNNEGFSNLLRMLTKANLEGFYKRPRVSPDMLLKYCGGLIFMTACTSSIVYMSKGRELVNELGDATGGNIYLEIMPHDYSDQKKLNRLLLVMSKKDGLPLVATNDCHYPLSKHTKVQEVLLAIQRKAKWMDKDRWRFEIDGLYLRTEKEMEEAFLRQGIIPQRLFAEALVRTSEIASKCGGYKIEKRSVILPKVSGYEDRDETELMWEIVNRGLKERLLVPGTISRDQLPAYRSRIKEEMDLICELGFQGYFLIVWELIDWCKKNDIMTGPGRGSSGGSLVAYLMRITDVDPIKYGLVFARFISPARIDLPDIDMDFEDIKRDRIRKHLEDNYGKFNVSGLSTFAKMKGRGAIRDVARVFDVPILDTDKCAKAIVVRSGGDFRSSYTIEDACKTFGDAIDFNKKYPEVVSIAQDLEGTLRASGQHAAAICISSEDLREGLWCHLCNRKGVVVANWEKSDAEYIGLMKLDILGLTALTILNYTKKLLKERRGVSIVFDDIPLDDEKVLSEIAAGNNVGAFQIGSSGLMKLCREMKVKEFNDIVLASALFRPGTLRSGMVEEFIQRRTGAAPVKYIHPLLEPLTKETLGIILYQEQVMWLMYELGGLGWKTCDTVRKVISKSQGDELFGRFKQLFIDGCQERKTLSEKEADKVWDQLSSFGSYSFNKSHAVEYSLITFWMMWLKAHYPKEYLCASLTFTGANDKASYIDEARRLGLSIELPRVGISKATEWISSIADDGKIFAPFSEIKGIGEASARQLEKAKLGFKKGFFRSREFQFGEGRRPNSMIMSVLEEIGALGNKELTDSELEKANKYFDFDLSKDKMGKYSKLFQRLKESMILSCVKDIDYQKPSTDEHYYFGQMTEVKFGYRQAVLKAQKSGMGDISGTDNLGGVYGNFKDETDFTMLIFGGELYQRKKADVEHCAGDWILAKANHPKRKTAILANDAWIGKELLSCDLEGCNIELISNSHPCVLPNIDKCSLCSLRSECKRPVPASPGKYNVMLIGEAPGKEEDLKGIGFIGKAGSEVLWPELAKYRLDREMFHITNIVKCWPSNTKTPSKKHIFECSSIIKEEISSVRPVLALAFGNTNVKFFKGLDSGIIGLNATTEWSNEYGMWICWCIHPAAVLYQQPNLDLFSAGIENFVKKLSYIAGDKLSFPFTRKREE